MGAIYRSIDMYFDAKTFGRLVAERRNGAHMSQVELASLINYSAAYIGYIERGQLERYQGISMLAYVQLCNLLDLDPRNFFFLTTGD